MTSAESPTAPQPTAPEAAAPQATAAPPASAEARPRGAATADSGRIIAALEANVARVVRGKPEVIRQAVVCLLARGHVLIEDVPGVGKTTLAHALARSLGLAFQRIQFTADLLPSDIIGVSIFNQRDQEFEFRPGPLFAHVVLADEINRATPKTQSALLEAMSERKVSVERKRYTLPRPFVVLATQNPLEYQGTFPLPESQLDRFLMSISIGYPPRDEERDLLLSGGVEDLLAELPPVLGQEDLVDLQEQVTDVRVAPKLVDYMLALAEATRQGGDFLLGASTRAVQDLYRASQALALAEGRPFAVPDDVQRLAPAVLGHRVVVRRAAQDLAAAREAVERLVGQVPVPE